jgi:membrane protein implicated in regulation of membrane protease activity
MKKAFDILMPAAAVLLSLGGIALYLALFLPGFNIYDLILAPVILAIYQIPAAWVFWLWRRRDEKQRPHCEDLAARPHSDPGTEEEAGE